MADNEAQVAPAAAPAAAAPAVNASTSEGVMDKMSSVIRANGGFITVLMIAVAACAFFIAYLLYWLINTFVISKKSVAIAETKVPVVANIMTKINGVASPVSVNGKRFTICFWVYVHDFDKYSGSMRHILHIGDEKISTGSPFAFFGPNDNKMYIGFTPNKESADVTNDLSMLGTDEMKRCMYYVNNYGIVIDYIPSQRWVHVAVVVNEESNGGTMSAYIDGDLVKVVNSGTQNTTSSGTTATLKLADINITRAGSLVIGGSTSDAIGPGFSGLVSGVRMFNYDLNINDVYNEYRSGPIDNLLAKLGLPAYGVRSPVYKI